jgi:hypothetical protein
MSQIIEQGWANGAPLSREIDGASYDTFPCQRATEPPCHIKMSNWKLEQGNELHYAGGEGATSCLKHIVDIRVLASPRISWLMHASSDG